MTEALPAPEWFGVFLDAVHDGVIIYDGDGRVSWVNAKACQLLGFPRPELIGRDVQDIVTLPTIRTIVTSEFRGDPPTKEWMQSKRIEDFTSPGYLVFADGRQLIYTGTQLRADDGALRYAIYTLRDVTELKEARQQVAALQRLTALYQDQLRTLHTQVLGRDLVFASESMRKILERTLKLARLDGNILFTGETGVGKNILAQYAHVMSRRARGPFVHVNCASLPESLVEAELFGHAEGAFTGAARKGRRGLIELGHGGTVFLDEIGEMPVAMQAKLLTVLEDKTVRRLGGEQWTTVDVRFLAATNQEPQVLLREKRLREDLHYRLTENRIHVPPLRERPDDIPVLIDHVLSEFNAKNGTDVCFDRPLIERIQRLRLSGNVRELKTLVRQILSEVDRDVREISIAVLPDDVMALLEPGPASGGAGAPLSYRQKEERQLRELCALHEGNVREMARQLGVHRTTVIRRLKEYGISYARRRAQRRSLPLI